MTPTRPSAARYELELNQVLPPDGQPLPEIVICEEKDLFACDLFAVHGLARRAAPSAPAVADVRHGAVRGKPRHAAQRMQRMARRTRLHRPVLPDLRPRRSAWPALCFPAKATSNAAGEFDGCGLLPEQVQGFGLGVMEARCPLVRAGRTGIDFIEAAASTARTAAALSRQTIPQPTT